MSKYLDPRADLTFKRVFGEHPNLVISLLNSLLPLPKDVVIKSVDYLPPELVPVSPLLKDTIVDVRCKDQIGRQFIVEMQMYWTAEFFKRIVFNSAKTFVKQAPKGGDYSKLQSVYSLNIINDIAFPDYPNEYIQEYCFVNVNHTDEKHDEFYLVFVELPKFKPCNKADKKLQDLWLKFLTEINENTKNPDPELLANPETREAIDLMEEAAFTEEELAKYERYWDAVSKYVTAHNAAIRSGMRTGEAIGLKKGLEKGLKKGEEIGIKKGEEIGIKKGEEIGIKKGEEIGIKKGEKLKAIEIARKLKSHGVDINVIISSSGLTAEEIAEI